MRKRKIISMLLSVLMICSIALFGCNDSTAHEHNMLKHEAQEATCEQEGNIEYWECEDCGKLFLDENGETETALEDVIVPKKAHEFSLKATVANKRYVENTLLSKSDLTFKFECDNCSTTQNVSSQDVTVDLSKPLVKGVNNFTATYSKDNVNLSCTFSVTAVQKELSDIQVTYTGKTEYLVNEDFDIDSLTVKAIYDNGTQEDVTELAQVEYDKSKAGEQEVTITYGGISKTITVTVTDIIQSLNVAVKEGRILVDGQKITADDLVVTAIGNSNEEYEITDFTIVNDDLSYPQTTVKVEYQGVEGSVVVDVYNNFKFPAGTNAKFGAGINGMPKVEDNGFVGNLSQNSGASLKFRIVSEESAIAILSAAVTGRRQGAREFSKGFITTVNGFEFETDVVVPQGDSSTEWSVSYEVVLGKIQLVKGVNVITFTVPQNVGNYDASNFDYIVISSLCEITVAENHNMTKHSAQNSTCAQEGNIAYWECLDCGKLYLDEDGVIELTLNDIRLPKLPHELSLKVTVANKQYIQNTLLSISDLVFELQCANCDHTELVNDDVIVDLSKPLEKGINNFTATYTKNNLNLSCNFSVTAVSNELVDLEVTYTGKTEYLVNDEFDIDSLTVKAVYENGDSEDITELAQIIYDMSLVGEQEVTIIFGGITKTISITISDIMESINVRLKDGKILLNGQTLTKDDLVVTVVWRSGLEEEVSDYTLNAEELSSPQTTIEVEYQGLECSVALNVYNNYKYQASQYAIFGSGKKGEPKIEGNGFIGNLSENGGATLTFKIVSEEDTTAILSAAVTGRRQGAREFSKGFITTVNGVELETHAIVPQGDSSTEWSVSYEVVLGEIQLVKGENTIVFTVPQNVGNNDASNFDYILISSMYGLTSDMI